MANIADRIRGMNNEELNIFLFMFKTDAIAGFLEKGAAGVADAFEQEEWLMQPPEKLHALYKRFWGDTDNGQIQ